jgi:hypothetical protein
MSNYKGYAIVASPEDNTWDIWDNSMLNWVESGFETLEDAQLFIDEMTA